MNEKGTRLAEWVCAAVALGVALFVWLIREREGGDRVAGKREPITKSHPRDGSRKGERIRRTKNPREEFEAARKRGTDEGAGRVGLSLPRNGGFSRLVGSWGERVETRFPLLKPTLLDRRARGLIGRMMRDMARA